MLLLLLAVVAVVSEEFVFAEKVEVKSKQTKDKVRNFIVDFLENIIKDTQLLRFKFTSVFCMIGIIFVKCSLVRYFVTLFAISCLRISLFSEF